MSDSRASLGDGPAPSLVVILPHLDDGVFGCGQLLATHPGAVVLTVFAGRPSAYGAVTDWDRSCGFGVDDDPVAIRREEDCAALAQVQARPLWLEFWDAQYGPSPAIDAIAETLDRTVHSTGARIVYVPLGLFHSDHQLTHTAARKVWQRRPELEWAFYEDAIYRRYRNLLTERWSTLEGEGLRLIPGGTSTTAGFEAKQRAVRRYRSQLRGLTTPGRPGYADVFQPERYWRSHQ